MYNTGNISNWAEIIDNRLSKTYCNSINGEYIRDGRFWQQAYHCTTTVRNSDGRGTLEDTYEKYRVILMVPPKQYPSDTNSRN